MEITGYTSCEHCGLLVKDEEIHYLRVQREEDVFEAYFESACEDCYLIKHFA